MVVNLLLQGAFRYLCFSIFLIFFLFINAFVFFTICICVCRYLYLCFSTWFLTWESGEGEGVVEGIGDPVRFGAATENSQR